MVDCIIRIQRPCQSSTGLFAIRLRINFAKYRIHFDVEKNSSGTWKVIFCAFLEHRWDRQRWLRSIFIPLFRFDNNLPISFWRMGMETPRRGFVLVSAFETFFFFSHFAHGIFLRLTLIINDKYYGFTRERLNIIIIFSAFISNHTIKMWQFCFLNRKRFSVRTYILLMFNLFRTSHEDDNIE